MELKLYWKSLKNEIDAETWKAGKCYITEDQAEKRAEAQVGNDTLDINYCYRKIEQGIMNLQDIAHKFFVGFNRGQIIEGSGNTPHVGDIVKYSTSSSNFYVGLVTQVTGSSVYTNPSVWFASDAECTIENYNSKINSNHDDVEEEKVILLTNTSFRVLKHSSSENVEQDINDEDGTKANNKLHNKISYWTINLKFGDRQHVNSGLLATELHKYVVLNVLQEWCKIANPQLTGEYVNRLAAEEIRVKSIMYRKEEPDWDE